MAYLHVPKYKKGVSLSELLFCLKKTLIIFLNFNKTGAILFSKEEKKEKIKIAESVLIEIFHYEITNVF
jgi:hypothetical protein